MGYSKTHTKQKCIKQAVPICPFHVGDPNLSEDECKSWLKLTAYDRLVCISVYYICIGMSRNFLTYNSVVYCGEDLQSCWVGAAERTECCCCCCCCCGGNINALNVQIREVCIWLLSFMHFEWFKSLIESRDFSIYTAKSHSLYSSSISISLRSENIYW